MKEIDEWKLCYKCKCIYPITYFNKQVSSVDGIRGMCKNCQIEYNNEWLKNNKEKHRETDRKWYQKHKERIKEKSRVRYKENSEEILDKNRLYRKTEKGKESKRKSESSRNRKLGYLELFNNPFPNEIEVEYHHINDLIVIPIPRCTHRITTKGHLTDAHRKECNKWIEKLYGLDLEKLFVDMI